MCECVGVLQKWGGTTLVTCDLLFYYTLYCACTMTSKHNRGAADEVDAITEQQMNRTQLGNSWVWPRETSARKRHYRTRVMVCQRRGLRQTHYEGGETSA